MGSFSIWHWLILGVIVLALWIIPMWKIVGRTGNHPALSLLFLVPWVNFIALWWLALGKWPSTTANQKTQER